MVLLHPFQTISFCHSRHNEQKSFILVACGPQLVAIDADSGRTLSTWPKATAAGDSAEPPEKKRRVESTAGHTAPNFIDVRIASDELHVVAVTAEDKAVHVFEISAAGQLLHLSQRLASRVLKYQRRLLI
jgi:hypothetical protein